MCRSWWLCWSYCISTSRCSSHVCVISSFRYCSEVSDRQRASPPHWQVAASLGTHCIVCCIFLCVECKTVDRTFGAHVTPDLYENFILLFTVVLCSSYRNCVWSCREGNDRRGTHSWWHVLYVVIIINRLTGVWRCIIEGTYSPPKKGCGSNGQRFVSSLPSLCVRSLLVALCYNSKDY